MAVLEKIRVKMGVFITVIIGIALLSFIIDADTLNSAVSMFSNKYDVGEMNGKAISYQDFQKKVDYFNRIHQMLTGSASVDEKSSEMVNQSAWQDLLSQNVILPTIAKAGISVGEEEMFDLSQGSHISPVLTREQTFLGEDGQFDRALLAQMIKAIPSDESGNLRTYWEYLEKNIHNDRMIGKYITLLAKSNIQNPVELRRSIMDNNVTSEVSFVMQPYGFAEDTTITVTKQEVRDFYNKNKHNFERAASRDIEYVVFEVMPSTADIDAASKEIESLVGEFRTATNLKNFLARNSDRPLDTYYYKKGELVSESAVLDSFAFAASTADLLEPYKEENVFRAARISDKRQMPDSVFVQHILIQNSDITAAESLTDSLVNLISKGADFSALANEYSADKNPNVENPGDLGWFTQSATIPGFDTCFVAAVGKPFKLKSQYGVHVIRVKERTQLHNKVQLAILEKTAIASKETFQEYYSQANDVASRSEGKLSKFNEVTKELGLYTIPAYNIAEGAKGIANYSNAREITRWAYSAKEGDVSQIISIDNKYFFIVALTDVKEEGIPSVESLEKEIASLLRVEKSQLKMANQVKEQIANLSSLEEIAEKLGTTVSTQSGVSFGSLGTRSFDPKFIGAVSGAEVNKIVGPIAGSVGVYVFTVTSRDTGSFFTEEDSKQKRDQLLNYQLQLLPFIFEKSAGVKDFRAKFF